jgi:hypothetical protein
MTINDKHTNSWIPVETKGQVKKLQEYFEDKMSELNIYPGLDKPKYVRYKQMESDFEIHTKLGNFQGKRGDYLFTDPSDGKAIVPFEIFQKIF